MPLMHSRERRVVLELIMELRLDAADVYFPALAGRTKQLYINILMMVALGHMKNCPATASSIARGLDTPRATVMRRLRTMIKMGIIERAENGYCLSVELANSPKAMALIDRSIRRVQAAAKRLGSPNRM